MKSDQTLQQTRRKEKNNSKNNKHKNWSNLLEIVMKHASILAEPFEPILEPPESQEHHHCKIRKTKK
jgi:hypothetical protein